MYVYTTAVFKILTKKSVLVVRSLVDDGELAAQHQLIGAASTINVYCCSESVGIMYMYICCFAWRCLQTN